MSDNENIILKQYSEIEDKILKKQKIKEKKKEYVLSNLKKILENQPKKSKPYYLYSLYYYYTFIYQNDFLFQNKKKLLEMIFDGSNHFLNEKNTQTIEILYAYLLKAKGTDEKINQNTNYQFLTLFVDFFYSDKNKLILKQQLNEIQPENLSQVFLNSYYFCAIWLSVIIGDKEEIGILLDNKQLKITFQFSSLEKLFLSALNAYNSKDYVYCISLLRQIKEMDKKKKFNFYIHFLEANISFFQKLPIKSIELLNILYKQSNKKELEKINILSKKILKKYPKLKTYFQWEISL